MKNFKLVAKFCAVSLTMLFAVSSLTACGGGNGGGDSSSPNLTISISPSVLFALLPFANPLTGVDISISDSAGDFLVTFSGSGSVSFTMRGSDNTVFFAADQNGGVMTISGNNNTIVFRGGDTASSVTITGTGNTIYMPSGSSITISGGGVNSNTVKVYRLI